MVQSHDHVIWTFNITGSFLTISKQTNIQKSQHDISIIINIHNIIFLDKNPETIKCHAVISPLAIDKQPNANNSMLGHVCWSLDHGIHNYAGNEIFTIYKVYHMSSSYT